MEAHLRDHPSTRKRLKTDNGCLPGIYHTFLSNPFQERRTAHDSSSNRSTRRHDELTDLLASEMYHLSVEERERVYHDLHGVSEPVQESPEFVDSKLQELANELDRIPDDTRKEAYNEARAMAPSYVESRKLRLMFLRGKRFSVKEAAAQLVHHFDVKKRLFGSEKLGRRIKFSDLGPEGEEAIKAGAAQILPRKDTSGRSVHFMMYSEFKGNVLGNSRKVYYNFMTRLEDEEMQKKGVILLYWMHQSPSVVMKTDIEMTRRGTEVFSSLPFRPVGLHYCGGGSSVNPLLEMGLKLVSKQMRMRFRAHLGSPLECIYALNAYGISRDMLPVDEENNLLPEEYQQWLEEQCLAEKHLDSLDYNFFGRLPLEEIKEAMPQDVLLGASGKEFIYNPGNISFRELLDKNTPEYRSTDSRKKKKAICQRVMNEIKRNGGRFLLRNDRGRWQELDDATSLLKLARAFRNRQRYTKDTIHEGQA